MHKPDLVATQRFSIILLGRRNHEIATSA